MSQVEEPGRIALSPGAAPPSGVPGRFARGARAARGRGRALAPPRDGSEGRRLTGDDRWTTSAPPWSLVVAHVAMDVRKRSPPTAALPPCLMFAVRFPVRDDQCFRLCSTKHNAEHGLMLPHRFALLSGVRSNDLSYRPSTTYDRAQSMFAIGPRLFRRPANLAARASTRYSTTRALNQV
jgi:hypothetical protein